jgi:hypothetical protein
MVYLGRAKYSRNYGFYIPLIVAENMELKDGDIVEFNMGTDVLQLSSRDLVARRSVNQDPISPRSLEERRIPGR